jgi:hypothetical protein
MHCCITSFLSLPFDTLEFSKYGTYVRNSLVLSPIRRYFVGGSKENIPLAAEELDVVP